MSFFRLELLDKAGKIVDTLHVNIQNRHSVDDALQDGYVKKVQRDAKERGLGFRVKREDD
jgi:hypothetical protein